MAKHKLKNFSLSECSIAIIAGIVLFFASAFLIGGSYKVIAFLAMLAALVLVFIKFKFYKENLSISFALLILIAAMGGFSTLWAVSGKFALDEFSKIIFALCASLVLLAVSSNKSKVNTENFASILALCAAITSFLSIDALSTRIFTNVLKIIPGNYFDNITGVEPGVRMVSILQNPNVFAGCAGIGVLLGLYNVSVSKKRIFDLCCLFINSVAFLLAFSMGASGAIAIAFILYIALEYKAKRASLLTTMLLTLVFAAINMSIVSACSFDYWSGFDIVPLAGLCVCCALFCLADRFVRSFLEKIFGGKAFLPIIIALVLICAAYVIAAFNITGSATIEGGKTLSRAAYPQEGQYTLHAEGAQGARVVIKSQNKVDTMMHTHTVIYDGELQSAEFTVPQDSIVVYFEIKPETTSTLYSLEYHGAESGRVPLGYKLLPDFIANRLQGLWANQNAIQRLVFFEDGLKLFSESPVVGLGLGAFGSAIKSVQSFFYETNYVHNHYIQSMVEMGVIGLILFASLIVLSFVLTLKARKKAIASAPVLCAVIVYMAVHAATEVVFSSALYLVLAFGVFTICGAECLPVAKVANNKIKCGFMAFCAVILAGFTVLLGMNLGAESMAKNNATFATMEKAIKLDVFEWEDYALSYVMASLNSEVDQTIAYTADEYAQKLSDARSNTIHYNLTAYYLTTGNIADAMDNARKHMSYCASSSDDWNMMYELLISAEGIYSYLPEYTNGVSELITMMNEWDSENIGSIHLNDNANQFVLRFEQTK